MFYHNEQETAIKSVRTTAAPSMNKIQQHRLQTNNRFNFLGVIWLTYYREVCTSDNHFYRSLSSTEWKECQHTLSWWRYYLPSFQNLLSEKKNWKWKLKLKETMRELSLYKKWQKSPKQETGLGNRGRLKVLTEWYQIVNWSLMIRGSLMFI